MTDAQLEAALDLTRRLPPSDIEDNLFYLLDLVPDLTDTLLSAVDQPLKAAPDEEAGRDYLLCDYNRDGDSFRSPWTNKYDPPVEEGAAMPSDRLREMEVLANKVFDRYRDVYYGAGSISSVYFWDLGDDGEASGWAACVLMYKEGNSGTWNSINVIEVEDNPSGIKLEKDHFQYKLTSTVMLSLSAEEFHGGLSGSLTRQETKSLKNAKDDPQVHISNMGGMVESMETSLRNTVDVVYFGKTAEVMSYLREAGGTAEAKEREAAQKRVIGEMSKAAN